MLEVFEVLDLNNLRINMQKTNIRLKMNNGKTV